jgi:hypothetical protein
MIAPPLAVAASGPDRIGRLAAELLLDRLDGLQGPPRHVVLTPLLLGPNERYIADAGAGDRVGPVVGESEGAPGQAPFITDRPAQVGNGSVPATRNRRGTTRTEQIAR